MSEVLLDQYELSVEQSNAMVLDSSIDTEVIETVPPIQIHADQFVLSSGDMYGSNGLIGAVPNWLLDAIQQELTTGDGNITSVVSGMQYLLDNLQTGITQALSSINTLSLSTSSITTGLQSQVNANNSAILSALATKVTAAEASALVATGIQSTFGTNASAYIGSIASTYVNAGSAIAQDVSLLATELNGVNASISEVSALTTETVLNPLWVNDGLNTDPDVIGHPRYITRAIAKKEIVVDANGVISGIALESGATSAVTIRGDQFKLVATGQSVASQNPFTVNATTGKISFNGIVDFTSTNASGTTTIDGGKITTGSITTNQLSMNTGWAGAIYNLGGTPLSYTMKVDFTNGEIHIK